ncbi:hypothetical protein HN51_021628, partial [Arachis hypogaea]
TALGAHLSSPRFNATVRSPPSARFSPDPPRRVLANRVSPLSSICAVCSEACVSPRLHQ